jgi:hypothetical protein
MAISFKKILTMSAEEYCKMMGKELTDYIPEGVHVKNGFERDERGADYLTILYEDFAEEVPRSAEVVVGYTISAATGNYTQCYASGTALILRTNDKKIKDDNNLAGGRRRR